MITLLDVLHFILTLLGFVMLGLVLVWGAGQLAPSVFEHFLHFFFLYLSSLSCLVLMSLPSSLAFCNHPPHGIYIHCTLN